MHTSCEFRMLDGANNVFTAIYAISRTPSMTEFVLFSLRFVFAAASERRTAALTKLLTFIERTLPTAPPEIRSTTCLRQMLTFASSEKTKIDSTPLLSQIESHKKMSKIPIFT